MGIPLTRQFSALLLSLACGGACGILYDLFRIFRVLFGLREYTVASRKLYAVSLPLIGLLRRPRAAGTKRIVETVAIALGDVLYGILTGCVFSVFLYSAASGCFRWFYLLGMGIGFFVYYFTLGRLVVLSSDVIVFGLRLIAAYTRYFLFLPVRVFLWMARWGIRVVRKRWIQPLKARLYTKRCRLYTETVRRELYACVRLTVEGVDDFAKVEK